MGGAQWLPPALGATHGEPGHGALTQLLDEVLHVQAQGVEGGGPALIVLLVDRDGGQAAAHSPLLEHVDLYPGAEVLLEEMGHCRAPDSGPNHGCQQAREAKEGRERAQAGVRPQVPPSPPPGFPCISQFSTFQKGNLQASF